MLPLASWLSVLSVKGKSYDTEPRSIKHQRSTSPDAGTGGDFPEELLWGPSIQCSSSSKRYSSQLRNGGM